MFSVSERVGCFCNIDIQSSVTVNPITTILVDEKKKFICIYGGIFSLVIKECHKKELLLNGLRSPKKSS